MIPTKPTPNHIVLAKHTSRKTPGTNEPLFEWFTSINWELLRPADIDGKLVPKQGWVKVDPKTTETPPEAKGEVDPGKEELEKIHEKIISGKTDSVAAVKLALYAEKVLGETNAGSLTKSELVELVNSKTTV